MYSVTFYVSSEDVSADGKETFVRPVGIGSLGCICSVTVSHVGLRSLGVVVVMPLRAFLRGHDSESVLTVAIGPRTFIFQASLFLSYETLCAMSVRRRKEFSRASTFVCTFLQILLFFVRLFYC